MTIINAAIAGESALVMVDSEVKEPGSTRVCEKLCALPRAGAVITGRGAALFLGSVQAGVMMAGFASFDDLDEAMPSELARASSPT